MGYNAQDERDTQKNYGEGKVLFESVRTILFDFDGTLVFHKPDTFDIISDFFGDIGQPLDEETSRQGRRLRHGYFTDPAIRSELVGLSRDEFWDHFIRHLLEGMGIVGDLGRLAQEVNARFAEAEMVYHCPEAGGRTLDTLQGRGYRLGLLTNRENVDSFHDLLERFSLHRYFSMILAAGELGIRKPNPGIFHAALERMEASPEESVYVGDNYWADVLGAEAAGVLPALLDPMGTFPEAQCVVLERIEDLLLQL